MAQILYRESSGVVEYASLPDAIQKLQRSINMDSPLVLEVRRSHIVKDALREARKLKFTTTKLAKVSVCIVMICKDDMIAENLFSQIRFVGEGAVDHGGPRREFFRLLAINAKEIMFMGPPTTKFFATNVAAIQVNLLLLNFVGMVFCLTHNF